MELSDNYPKEQLQGLNKMRKQGKLCDVTILVAGKKFRAHKALLAATGDYFFTMFTAGFRESSAQEITIEGSPAAFEILLNFVYTGGVQRKKVSSCISEVLEMGCKMQITAFVNTCSAVIQKLLTAKTEAYSLSDVCKVMMLAKTHDLKPVYPTTVRYLKDKVESLKCLDMFLENISAPFLEEFLCLGYADEEKHVLELVINWLKHDWEKRKEYSQQLLQKVRLGLVAPEDIKKLIGPEILDIPGCSDLVNRARSTVTAPVLLMDDKEVGYYDVKRKEWMSVEKMDPAPMPPYVESTADMYELIVVKGVLYAAGGPGNGREFFKYQASENKWIPLSSKPLTKNQIKLVALGVYIYAFGSYCECMDLHQVIERYDINAEKWEVLKVQKSSKSGVWRVVVVDTPSNKGKCKCTQYQKRREMFAVAFEGKIFVSSLNQKKIDIYLKHKYAVPQPLYRVDGELVIFDPVMSTYKVQDKFGGGQVQDEPYIWEDQCFKPTLFIYEDQLHYMETQADGVNGECHFLDVTRLSVTQKDDKTKVGHGDQLELLHDFLDEETLESMPFCVQDYLSVKQSGTAGSKAAGHGKVKFLPEYGGNKQLMYVSGSDLLYPVWFSFEKKLTVPNRK